MAPGTAPSKTPMITLLRREFIVDAPRERAWQHLARVEQWPSWATHIRRIELQPAGELGPSSTGVIHLRNGLTSAFSMTEFHPNRNWKWVGPFLWLTVYYDHRFEEIAATQTRLIWTVTAEGFGVSVFGRLFAFVYARNLKRAIPALIDEINASAVS